MIRRESANERERNETHGNPHELLNVLDPVPTSKWSPESLEDRRSLGCRLGPLDALLLLCLSELSSLDDDLLRFLLVVVVVVEESVLILSSRRVLEGSVVVSKLLDLVEMLVVSTWKEDEDGKASARKRDEGRREGNAFDSRSARKVMTSRSLQ